MDSEYSASGRRDESQGEIEIRETHPLLNDSEREVHIINVEVKPTAPPHVADEPSTSATAIRRQSQNSSTEDVTDRCVDAVTTEPLPSSTLLGESLHQSEPDSSLNNHNQLKSKFDSDEPENVEGYAYKICCTFIQCCAIFIDG